MMVVVRYDARRSTAGGWRLLVGEFCRGQRLDPRKMTIRPWSISLYRYIVTKVINPGQPGQSTPNSPDRFDLFGRLFDILQNSTLFVTCLLDHLGFLV